MPASSIPATVAVSSSNDPVMKEIRSLTSDELIVRLINHGIKPGPITGTTRPLFEKKLQRILTGGGDMMQKDTSNNCNETQDDVAPPAPSQSESDSTIAPKDNMFYGVQIPIEARQNEMKLVFQDKKEALRLVKSYSGSRFKPFLTRDEAQVFSQQNPDQVPPSPKPTKMLNEDEMADGKPVSEGSAFRGPKPQELVRLRKAIESADKATVLGLAWTNPRYLIGSGDNPTVLQEGFRYNAIHVCAQKNQHEICDALLDILQNTQFIRMLYPDDTEATTNDRITFITDLYLNTPDKGNNETPLHFACKFGFPDVVQVLVRQSQLDKTRKNRYGETAAQMVCSRARSCTQEIKDRITNLLEAQYYVPLLRSEDEWQIAPEPWEPETLNNSIDTTDTCHTPPPPSSSMASPSPQQPPRTPRNDLHLPTQSPLKVKAVAGPMSPVQAEKFRKEWVAPPSSERRQASEIKRSDYDKGLERIGRCLAKKMNISWTEYWNFLHGFADIGTKQGLAMLESYLAEQVKKYDCTPPILSLEQQFAQLNLSDSGEDSGIENQREQHSPPQSKRKPASPSASPSPKPVSPSQKPTSPSQKPISPSSKRQPVTISLYMKKPSPKADANKTSPLSKITPVVGPTLSNNSLLLNKVAEELVHNTVDRAVVEKDHSFTSSPLGSAETTLQASGFLSSGSVTPNVGSPNVGSPNVGSPNVGSPNVGLPHTKPVKSPHTCAYSRSNSTSSSPKPKPAELDLLNSNTIGKALDNVTAALVDQIKQEAALEVKQEDGAAVVPSAEIKTRERRLSSTSIASTTSDMSTDSYHTCFEEMQDDKDSITSEDFEDFEVTDFVGDLTISPYKYKSFIYGSEPTKDDIDVLRAIEQTPVSPEDYPHVYKWRDALLQYSEEERNKFCTPKKTARTPSSSSYRLSASKQDVSLQQTPPRSSTARKYSDSMKKDLLRSFMEDQ